MLFDLQTLVTAVSGLEDLTLLFTVRLMKSLEECHVTNPQGPMALTVCL